MGIKFYKIRLRLTLDPRSLAATAATAAVLSLRTRFISQICNLDHCDYIFYLFTCEWNAFKTSNCSTLSTHSCRLCLFSSLRLYAFSAHCEQFTVAVVVVVVDIPFSAISCNPRCPGAVIPAAPPPPQSPIVAFCRSVEFVKLSPLPLFV